MVDQIFDCLCDAIPNQLFYGADTNVRNQFILKGQKATAPNIWQDEDILELQLLKYLPLANKQFTAENTFHHTDKPTAKDLRDRQDFRNEPLAGVGGLDVNAYLGSMDETPPLHPKPNQK